MCYQNSSASWTDQFFFTQMKAVSLGLHVFERAKNFQIFWGNPSAVTLQNTLIW